MISGRRRSDGKSDHRIYRSMQDHFRRLSTTHIKQPGYESGEMAEHINYES